MQTEKATNPTTAKIGEMSRFSQSIYRLETIKNRRFLILPNHIEDCSAMYSSAVLAQETIELEMPYIKNTRPIKAMKSCSTIGCNNHPLPDKSEEERSAKSDTMKATKSTIKNADIPYMIFLNVLSLMIFAVATGVYFSTFVEVFNH